MPFETEITFFRRLLDNLHIETRRFLRSDVIAYTHSSHEEFLKSHIEEARSNTIYICRNVFMLCFAYLLLPGTDEILLVGPFLLEEIKEPQIMQLLEKQGLPASMFPSMRKLIGNLTHLSGENTLMTALCTLGETLWGGSSAFDVERIRPNLPFSSEFPIETGADRTMMEASDFYVMEERYKAENQLLHLISQGHTHRAQMIIAQMNEVSVEKRAADSLHNLKYYGIVLNTLARKAAEEGGVHPMHIDKLSSQIARRMNNAMTVDECRSLFQTMVHKYCLLVKNHSMKSYSLLVQHVILRIESDLTADLSLKAHSDALSVNASYLSTLFKKETGMTLTEYVSRKRMDQAIFLLNSTDMQIQTIAQYCGIPDVNYFTKTFKRIVGKTPKEYRICAKNEQ